MGQPPEATTGQQQAFDVDAWARDRARAKLGRVLLRQSQRKANARPPAATPPPLPTARYAAARGRGGAGPRASGAAAPARNKAAHRDET